MCLCVGRLNGTRSTRHLRADDWILTAKTFIAENRSSVRQKGREKFLTSDENALELFATQLDAGWFPTRSGISKVIRI
jgi:hypothetical protein